MTEEKSKQVKYDLEILHDLLPVYYKRLFPHEPIYRWLSYKNSLDVNFDNREFSFTLQNDVYVRHLCYENQSEFEKDICSKNPLKIDIGAVMETRPSKNRMLNRGMVPFQRELVLDIDVSDYNDVRTCCSGVEICKKCWKFMILAVRILDAVLREDFGFKHILWVFSGRRGIHCWVCDFDARHMNSIGRTAVADYIQVTSYCVISGISTPRASIGDRIHHSIRRALKFIESSFDDIILEDQNLFATSEGLALLLRMISEEGARADAEKFLKEYEGKSSKVIWAAFRQYVNAMRSQSSSVWNRKLKNIVEEIQLATMYPRLDVNVTKGFNHLLKMPFCIHPSTGKICLPFSASAVGKFDPTSCPTIMTVMQEINAFDEKASEHASEEKSRIKDYKKTSMLKGVVVFEEFIHKLENAPVKIEYEVCDISDIKMEF